MPENRTVRLPAADLQNGRDGTAAAAVLVGTADNTGADLVEVGTAAGQEDLRGLGGAGGAPASAAVHIVDGGCVANAGDIAAADQGGLGRVDLNSGVADTADAAAGHRDRKTGIGAGTAAAVFTTAGTSAAVGASGAAAAARIGRAATGRTARTATGAIAAAGFAGRAVCITAARTGRAAGRTITCHKCSKPPYRGLLHSIPAGENG